MTLDSDKLIIDTIFCTANSDKESRLYTRVPAISNLVALWLGLTQTDY